MRMIRFLLSAALLLLGLVAWPTQADEPIAVVANPASGIGPLSREEVAGAFLGDKRIYNGGRQVVVFDLDDETIRQAFYGYAAHRSPMQVRAYWARMVFTGNGRPPKSLQLNRLMEKLRTDANAIGYLPSNKTGGLKILLLLSAE